VAKTFVSPGPSWTQIFEKLLSSWAKKPFPILSETTQIRAFLYELLMRNLRWTDCVHYLLDVVLDMPLERVKKQKILAILAKQEATAAGQTIPSYRIPLLWEALFLEIREALSQDKLDGGPSSRIECSGESSKIVVGATVTKVVARHSKSKGAPHV
jgi:hypothetical protein